MIVKGVNVTFPAKAIVLRTISGICVGDAGSGKAGWSGQCTGITGRAGEAGRVDGSETPARAETTKIQVGVGPKTES